MINTNFTAHQKKLIIQYVYVYVNKQFFSEMDTRIKTTRINLKNAIFIITLV